MKTFARRPASRKLLFALLAGSLAAAVGLSLWRTRPVRNLEAATWTWRVEAFARPEDSTSRIKLILLDQGSLDWGEKEMGLPWPWPREVYGPLLDFCRRGGAKTVAFDVLFTESSAHDVGQDAALGDAIARTPGFVAALFLGKESGAYTAWPIGVTARTLEIAGMEEWMTHAFTQRLVSPRAAFPIPEVATNATWLADVKGDPDRDGIIRRTRLFRVFDRVEVPSLALASLLAAEPDLDLKIESGWFHYGAQRIPIDRGARTIVRYRGPAEAYQTFTAAQVIQSELRLLEGGQPAVDPAVFKDAFVFFGFSAPGLLDLRPTPLSPVAPGVVVHATLLDNLLQADAMRDCPPFLVVVLTWLVAMTSALLVLFSRRVWQTIASFLLLLPVPMALGFLFYSLGQWWPVMVGELSVLVALIGAVVINYATEGRQKAFIKQAFRHYLGEQVIDQIIDDPSRLQLGGERRELTIFFSDIEKFSSFSERLDPPTLTALLNEYLTEMGGIIQEEGGYLDKFIGDAIVAFWNAPLAQEDHGLRAVRAALRCQRRLAERRDDWKAKFDAVIRMRIGLNTGEVNVGNMGSHDRFNYTVLGDAANLASRLEGANKQFHTYMMISEETFRKAGDAILARRLGRIRVVGRAAPVTVYEPIGLEGEEVPPGIREFENGLELCDQGRWQEAVGVFEALPDDPVAATYAKRCRDALLRTEEKWDGIWNLTEK